MVRSESNTAVLGTVLDVDILNQPTVVFRDTEAPQLPAAAEQYVVVSCYTRFDNLAHGPKGKEGKRSLYTFRLDPNDGQMVLVSVSMEEVMNPAFSRFHRQLNILYTCTESVAENGQIDTWSICPRSGQLNRISRFDAQGTSTCYLTMDRENRNLLVVNYWDASIGVFGLSPSSGEVTSLRSLYSPNKGRQMHARHDRHVNHSQNDASAQKERQKDPHSHAVILDPFFGKVAFVPDLGMDVIREFKYDGDAGQLTPASLIQSGSPGRKALGPRYVEFHPFLPVVYVINELSSEVSVFEFNMQAAEALIQCRPEDVGSCEPTLRLVQSIRTIPEAFPGDLNTCGRLAVHPSGNFVLVSNRGHDSISVFRVHHALPGPGLLSSAWVQHTQGATPRHFQFDGSGQWLIAANQDSDSLGIFQFNLATGRLDWTGHKYSVPSPNFVCAVRPHVAPSGAATTSGGLSVPRAKL